MCSSIFEAARKYMPTVFELSPNMHFLVIDDSPSSRESIVATLKTIGLKKVTEGSSEGEALKLLKEKGFDFIICAKDMRQMNGLEFLATIRESMEIPRIPFMIAGSEVTKEERDFYPEAIPDGFLKTPFLMKELSGRITQTIKQYLDAGLNELEFESARDSYMNGEYEKALEIYSKISKNTPNSARALVGIGRCYRASGNFENAKQFLRQALEKNKKYIQAYFDLAICLLAADEKYAALQAFDYAIHINPKNPIHYEMAANILTRMELYVEAESYLMRAINLKIIYPQLYAQVGRNFLSQKRKDKALEFLQRAIEQDPKNPSFLNSIGICYKEMGRYEYAISSYNLALKFSPNDTKIIYNKILCFIVMKDFVKAKKMCYQILKIDPNSERAAKKIIEIEKIELEVLMEQKNKGIKKR